MRSPCCVDDPKLCPRAASCSMVLRSACTHKHFPKSPTISWSDSDYEAEACQERKIFRTVARKSSGKSRTTLDIGSLYASSLKHISIKSTNAFSFLKHNLYRNVETDNNQQCETVENNQFVNESDEDVNGNKCTTASDTLFLKRNINASEYTTNSYTTDLNSSIHSREMSRTRLNGTMYSRTISNALSDSENEELSVVSRSTRLRRSQSSTAANSSISLNQNASLEYSTNAHSSSNQNFIAGSHSAIAGSDGDSQFSMSRAPTDQSANFHTAASSPESHVLSSVQYSTFDRFRWFLWKYIYLLIIKLVTFYAYLLSRVHHFGKLKIMMLLVLPFIFYLLYSTLPSEAVDESYVSVKSTIFSFPYWLYSAVSNLLSGIMGTSSSDNSSCPSLGFIFQSFAGMKSYFSNLLFKKDESAFYIHTSDSKKVHKEVRNDLTDTMAKRNVELENKIQMMLLQQEKIASERDMHSEISSLHNQFNVLAGTMQQMQKEALIKETYTSKDMESLTLNVNEINSKLHNLGQNLHALQTVKKCCDDKLNIADVIASLEKHFITAFKNVMDSDKNRDSPFRFFNDWLNSKFVNNEKLSLELNSVVEKFLAKQKADGGIKDENNIKVLNEIVQHYMESLKKDLKFSATSADFGNSLSTIEMQRIVKEALMLYDADKIGLVDYALESGGGSVLGTRCSESYIEKSGKFSLLGFPLWSDQNSPRTTIQPGVQPGQCWAFKGSQGFLVIQLSYTIHPTGFTLEHIPVSLSPTGIIDSAPRDFSVWGLISENDNEGKLMGQYSYDSKGEPLQYFPILNLTSDPVSFVELKIHSNHGNLEYTCLYRFRVHGTRV